LIKLSLIRAKFMELLADELYGPPLNLDYFFVGLFSFLDVSARKADEADPGWPPISGEPNRRCWAKTTSAANCLTA
jgi:hypothetical protein